VSDGEPGEDAAARRDLDREIGEELARWGRVCIIETIGRRSGRPARAAVGFVEDPDGSLLVAAGSEAADWARNLAAEPRCRVTIEARTEPRRAVRLEGPEHNAAIVALILRYGTPAERLGEGPAFRLEPDSAPPA
jgi:deazaflavin-dependent oxidoreductase (nitroreductase family)